MAISGYLNNTFNSMYVAFAEQIPNQYKPFIILALYTLLIVIYAIIIFRVYKFLARRNVIDLNLSKYNRTENPFWNKLLASFFFFIEYIIIVPILVFFWFSFLAILLLLLSKTQTAAHILLISAAVVAATRMAAYYSGDLSKDLAKIFPFTLLVIFLLDKEFFVLEKLIERFAEIPSLLGDILVYLIFIAGLEIIFRFLFTVIDLFSSNKEQAMEEVKS